MPFRLSRYLGPAAALSIGLIAGVAFAACSSGGNKPASPTVEPSPTSVVSDDPMATVNAMVDALNRQDTQGILALLSSQARADLTEEQLATLVFQTSTRGRSLHVSIANVGDKVQTADQAQITLSLDIRYQGRNLNLRDVAFLVQEQGVWKVADHFLQTALIAVGRSTPVPVERVIGSDGCVQGDVLAGVYLPSRLQVLAPCTTVEGIVHNVETPAAGEGDGDLTFDLELGAADQRLLNDGNRQQTNGYLHLEIIPTDQARLPTPRAGQRVRARGAWVLDTIHGFNEIHPVWSLDILSP